MKVKEESDKAGLKYSKNEDHGIWSITSRQIDGVKWRQWRILFSWLPNSLWMVTAATKLRLLLLGRIAMTNLDSVLKKQRYHFADKGPYKATDFLVIMYRCENWTIKKAEHQRIDAFQLWCWRESLEQQGDQTSHPKRN